MTIFNIFAGMLRTKLPTGNLPSPTHGWKNLPIQAKLPATFVGFALVSILSIIVVTAQLNRSAQFTAAEKSFKVSVENRANEISQWLHTAKATLKTSAQGKQAIDALYSLSAAFKDIKDGAKENLQNSYIFESPYASGERYKLARGEGMEFYHAEHARFHKTFLSIMQEYGLYDIFLINRDGDIIYTVAKEGDFADNLNGQSLQKTGLADIFKKAMNGKVGEVFLSSYEPYGPSNNAFALFMATPIVTETGATVGVMALQLPETGLTNAVNSNVDSGEATESYIVNRDLIAMTNSSRENGFAVGGKVAEQPHLLTGWDASDLLHADVVLQSGEQGLAFTKIIEAVGTSWLMVTERSNADIYAPFYSLLKMQAAIAAVSIAVVAFFGLLISRQFTLPISALNVSIKKVAEGDYDSDVPFTSGRDEIGTIAKSIDAMRLNLKEAHSLALQRADHEASLAYVVGQLTESMKAFSDGDLSLTIDKPFAQTYEVLRTYFNDSVLKTRDSIQRISVASEGMRAQSAELTRASEDLAHRTEVQAATLEETAAAMDEITASVKSAADGIREVEAIVVEARKDADDCGTVVKSAVTAMAEIEKSSGQIGQIIGVIDDIAFQTNLLALNAGVEAARAGEAGRGFAVVALEVGALAQRASTAAKEIKSLIGTSTEQVERGVTQVKQAGVALQQIAQRVTQISSLTTNIATGAAEQALGLNEINVGVTHLDQSTQQNAAMAEQASAASQLMRSGTQELADLVARFKFPAIEVHKPANKLFDFDPRTVDSFQDKFTANGGIQTETPAARKTLSASVDHAGSIDTGEILTDDTDAKPMRMAAGGSARGVWQDF